MKNLSATFANPILPPRAASPCALNNPGCGPIVVSRAAAPIPTPTTSVSAATCTPYPADLPIFELCSRAGSGSQREQCIADKCMEYQNTCECPGSPPEKRDVTTSASAATCTPYPADLPIFELCSRAGSGSQREQCIADRCMEYENTCGCPGSPPEAL